MLNIMDHRDVLTSKNFLYLSLRALASSEQSTHFGRLKGWQTSGGFVGSHSMLFKPLLLWKKRYSSFTPLAWLANTKPVWKRKRSTRMINDPTHLKTEVHVGNIRASNGKQCALEKGKCTFYWKFASSHLGDGVGGILQITRKVCPSNNTCHSLRRRKIQDPRQFLQLWSLSINPSLLAHQWQRWRRLRRRPWTKDLNQRCLAWESEVES